MKRNLFLSMFGIAAMLASCSSDEELQNVATDGLSTVTLTARIDDAVNTRATYDTDDAVSRCILEVRETGGDAAAEQYQGTVGDAGTYTFDLTLKQDVNYDFLFWADNGTSYTTGDLKNVTLSAEANGQPGIAYSGSLLNTPPTTEMTVTLTHAVAKVTLNTTGTLPIGHAVTVNIPTYTSFDVSTGDVTGSSSAQEFTATYSAEVTNAEVFSFYVLAKKDSELVDATVSCDDSDASLTYVPLQMNYRTVLAGDVIQAGKVDGDITATLDDAWNDNAAQQPFPQLFLQVQDGETLTNEMIEAAISEDGTLIVKGDLTADDVETLGDYLNQNNTVVSTLDMWNCTVTEIPEKFTHSIRYDKFLTLSTLVLPKGTTSVGKDAFLKTNIKTLTLPETLETIGSGAFQHGNLTNLTIPASVTSIGYLAFRDQANLETVTFKGTTPINCSGLFPDRCTIYVPSGSKQAFVDKSNDVNPNVDWNSRIQEY